LVIDVELKSQTRKEIRRVEWVPLEVLAPRAVRKETDCGRPVGEYINSSWKIFTFKNLSSYQPPESSLNEIVAHIYIPQLES
jgi:hypothetical protein